MTEDSDAQPQEESILETNRKKYEFIEDLPGVGPATAQKLKELGYHTVESLAMATARELDPVGVSEKKAFQIIEAARSSIGIAFIRADELLQNAANRPADKYRQQSPRQNRRWRIRNPNNNRVLR